MSRIEENLNPTDRYIFLNTHCVHPNENVAHFCEYQADSMGHNILAAVLHDSDYDYFNDLEMFALRDGFNSLVTETLNGIYDTEDGECHPDVLYYLANHYNLLGELLYWQYYWYHANVLSHVGNILEDASKRNIKYVDFQLSSDGDKHVLRLIRGITL